MPTPKKTWYSIKNFAADEAVIDIYDEIGLWGIQAADFVADVRNITASRIKAHINSPGGMVYDGIAMYNALRQHPAHVTTVVDSLAASIASILAMAGDEVLIHETARIMIHEPWVFMVGNSTDLRKEADNLDDLRDTTLKPAYKRKMGDKYDDKLVSGLIVEESWLNAQKCLEYGFVDKIIEETEAPEDKYIPMQWSRGIGAYNFKRLPKDVVNLYTKDKPRAPSDNSDLGGETPIDYSYYEKSLISNSNCS